MAAFGEAFLNLVGQKDPRLAALAAVQGGGATGTPAGGPGTQDGMGTGAGMGGPAPQQPQVSEVYNSPPQLMELYTQLMDRQRKANLVERGVGMMGASLAHDENRAGILRAFSGDSGEGSGGVSSFVNSLMQFQQSNLKAQQQAAQRAALPSIASRYGLDLATAQFLFDTGKLDAVIAEAEKPDKQIIQGADGKSYIVNKRTGEISEGLGPEKEREMELVDDPVGGGKFAVWKDTKERVGKNDIEGAGNTNDQRNWRAAMETAAPENRVPFDVWLERQNKSKAPTVNVGPTGIDYGDPPKDMAWVRNQDGTVKLDERGIPMALPIQGTAAFTDPEDAKKKAAEKENRTRIAGNIVTEDIDRLSKKIDDNKDTWLPVTGFGSWLKDIPGTDALDANALTETIKANIGFDKLQAMRDASPTGAALGPVSDFENQLLQATFGNLNLAQGHEQVRHNLDRIKEIYLGVMNGDFVTDGKPNEAGKKAAGIVEADKNLSDDDLIKKWSK